MRTPRAQIKYSSNDFLLHRISPFKQGRGKPQWMHLTEQSLRVFMTGGGVCVEEGLQTDFFPCIGDLTNRWNLQFNRNIHGLCLKCNKCVVSCC